ncbi:MAG TPA: RNA 2',3'-cyclic phosphodiesterase [Candidatus Accumulibacter phosphatis]|nr:MAG: 2'-5'-RNA ligase [Candidatus Accumulibacter sp. SK-11]HAY26951.1 RNA 2',3'-cyclic phosphodiesterase [Accumulibacter sp.]HRL77076.1 RNA 2',3'-cyclic phosphodiesterase [Candidatus Accumulibacter phosphatis]HRQ96012.1 RNA 2',3'-cyclic phosphodiesterase [Candidatus Accumulibacter phosphatis]
MPEDANDGMSGRQAARPGRLATADDAAATRCRLFLALWPTPAENQELLHYLRQWSWSPGTTPVAAERLHLTLHFIGSLPRQRLDELRSGLRVAVEPFELALNRAEAWPHGLVVLRAASPPAALQRLHDRLGEALQALRLAPERRRFRPHVTLARRATASIPPLAAADLRWQVGSYTLVESLAGGTGGYLVRQRYD